MHPVDGNVTMQVIVDRPMMKVCGSDGAVYITDSRGTHGDVSAIEAFAKGGQARLNRLDIHELQSIWNRLIKENCK